MNFSHFFKQATGKDPFPYQERLATSSLPKNSVLTVPTGAGKTAAAVLGWLWRRIYAPQSLRKEAPVRLIYCLPMRVLVEQTFEEAKRWLHALELGDRVGVEKLMGGEGPSEWFLAPERPTIVVGTQDMLLSRALNRGYGMSRYRWPIEFGLLNNDCLWVFDEVQLMGAGLATTTQLAAFRETFGTFADCRTMWMSATLVPEWFQSVDLKRICPSPSVKRLSVEDRGFAEMKTRLMAKKTIKKCSANISDMKALARSVLDAHQQKTLTLLVLNTVDRAIQMFQHLRAMTQTISSQKAINNSSNAFPETVLLHSRFRPTDRTRNLDILLNSGNWPHAGLIVVSTQVIEAGINISARTLFTELAPLSSMIQRFGRCNRFGEYQEASIYWIDVLSSIKGKSKRDLAGKEKIARPYDVDQLEAASGFLEVCYDMGLVQLTEKLEKTHQEVIKRLFPYNPKHVIRKKDLLELFDTTSDMAGNDIDVSRFIREGDELDVQVFWRDFGREVPSNQIPGPLREELCAVPAHIFREFIAKQASINAYRWDPLQESWVALTLREIFPGQVYLIPCADGGYSNEIGWDPHYAGKVSPVPAPPDSITEQDEYSADHLSRQPDWERISEHTDKVNRELMRLLDQMNSCQFSDSSRESLMEAGRWHDRGKAHDIFRAALGGNNDDNQDFWAKAPSLGKYTRKGFRHELAGALAMLQAGKTDLACYLAAAHHGKVRLSIRSLALENHPPDPNIRFARGIWDGDRMPPCPLGGGIVAPEVVLSLEPMELGMSHDGKPSWAERILNLRNDPALGPFRLAMLESILRIADILASRRIGIAAPTRSNKND